MNFLEDERGVSGEVFKLAMAVIVIAAILALLAGLIGTVKESSTESVETTGEAMKNFSNRIKDEIKNF